MWRGVFRAANIPVASILSRTFKVLGIDDQQLPEEDWDTEGKFAYIASKLLMKLMYGARTMRSDLLQPLAKLAQDITKWIRYCDVRMHNLLCYATLTFHHSMKFSAETFANHSG